MTTPDYQSIVDALTTERQRARDEQLQVVQAAFSTDEHGASHKRELTADEEQKLVETDEAIERLGKQIDEWRARAEREREQDIARAAAEPFVRPAEQDARQKREADDFTKFLRGQSTTKAFDLDMCDVANQRALIRAGGGEREVRDLLKVASASGGYTVPTDFLNKLYDFLEVYSGMRRTGATIITTASGASLQIPKVASHGTAAIVGEGSALAENDATFGQVTLLDWKYGELLQLSNELLTDTGVDVLGFVAKDMGRALGRVTDTAYFSGTGSSQPQGVIGQYATGVTGQASATGLPSYTNLVDTVYSVNELYRMNGAKWLFRDQTVGKLRTILDTTGRPIWSPGVVTAGMTDGTPDTLMGYPIVTDPNFSAMSSNIAIGAFGDFSGFYIRDVGSIRVERSDDFAFSSDLVTFRAIIRTDSKIVDTLSVRVLKGGT